MMTNGEVAYAQYLIDHRLNRFVCNTQTAIKALRPTARYALSEENGEFIFNNWEDEMGLEPPTTEEVKKELAFQEKFCAYWQFFLDRVSTYPEVVVLLGMLWEAIDKGDIPGKASDFYKVIKDVNDQYPAPDEEPPTK